MKSNRIQWCFFLLICAVGLPGEVLRLPRLFTDHMVVQRGHSVAVWGWAAVGDAVTVRFAEMTAETRADEGGQWRVDFEAQPAGGPHRLAVSAGPHLLEFTDVMVGDVWVCSGQSNMNWTLRKSHKGETEAAAASNRNLRLFRIAGGVAIAGQDDLQSEGWSIATPRPAGDFSAVGYVFGETLQAHLGVPVGLIQVAEGGTSIETWMSFGALEQLKDFAGMAARVARWDLAALTRKSTALEAIWAAELPLLDVGWGGGNPRWADTLAPGAVWTAIDLPQGTKTNQLDDLDGVFWYRRAFVWPADETARFDRLSLGFARGPVKVWLNGSLIADGVGPKTVLQLVVPAALAHSGENRLVVRVVDTVWHGGLRGRPDDYFVGGGGYNLRLSGEWESANGTPAVPARAPAINITQTPGVHFNARIAPLFPAAIRGVIWYQGESNAGRAEQYKSLFPALINDWRARWLQPQMPFLFVQLASYHASPGVEPEQYSHFAELREAQACALSLPATGMAVALDVGEFDIHPRDKRPVGQRLALLARRVAYGETALVSEGPRFAAAEFGANRVTVRFNAVGGGLRTRDNRGPVGAFTIAGEDRVWHWADAAITGPTTVEIWSQQVPAPVAVRHAWLTNAGGANLTGGTGLPAAPFRTDSWQLATADKRFSLPDADGNEDVYK